MTKFQIKGPSKPAIEYYIIDDTVGWLNLEKSTGILRIGELPEKGIPKLQQVLTVVATDAEKQLQLASTELFVNVTEPTFIPDFTEMIITLTVPSGITCVTKCHT